MAARGISRRGAARYGGVVNSSVPSSHTESRRSWRIVFFGTPEFAVPSLQALVKSGEQVVLAICQPDKPAGRGQQLVPPPVKQVAAELGIPVFQPPTLRTTEAVQKVAEARPDLIVVVGYGKILPRSILALPPNGCLNVHASLLPRYRGAAPIQWALLQGEEETGISIILLTEEMDAGPVLLQRRVLIGVDETYGELQSRLSGLGAECLLEALAGWRAGTLKPEEQDTAHVSFAPLIRKEQGRIRWAEPAERICRQVRAFNPWPGAFCFWGGRLIKIHRARPTPGVEAASPGTVIEAGKRLLVQAGQGAVEILELQMEGRRRMRTHEFLSGHPIEAGTRLE